MQQRIQRSKQETRATTLHALLLLQMCLSHEEESWNRYLLPNRQLKIRQIYSISLQSTKIGNFAAFPRHRADERKYQTGDIRDNRQGNGQNYWLFWSSFQNDYLRICFSRKNLHACEIFQKYFRKLSTYTFCGFFHQESKCESRKRDDNCLWYCRFWKLQKYDKKIRSRKALPLLCIWYII